MKDKKLNIILVFSILFIIVYILTNHIPQLFIGKIGLGIIFDILLNLSIGYILSYIFYAISIIKPQEIEISQNSFKLLSEFKEFMKEYNKAKKGIESFFTSENLNSFYYVLPKDGYIRQSKKAQLVYNHINTVKKFIEIIESIPYENSTKKIINKIKLNGFLGVESLVKVYSENNHIKSVEGDPIFRIQDIYRLNAENSKQIEEAFKNYCYLFEELEKILGEKND